MTNISLLNPDELYRACEVVRKSISVELGYRQENWATAEAEALKGDPHYTSLSVSDYYEDMLDAQRAEKLWYQLEANLLSPFKGIQCDSVKQS